MFAEQRPVRVEVTLAVEGFFVASLPGVYAEVASSRADVQAPTVLSVLRLLRKVLQPLLMLEGMSGFWAMATAVKKVRMAKDLCIVRSGRVVYCRRRQRYVQK
jgi:hypothetical protein